uniref:Uncharacterized protein n=1 Tax=Avena sativa TaxID=4498 RepID=A0ACD6A600_AVESA
MAFKQMLIFAAASLAVIAFLPAFAVATEHIVGDESGWVLNFDYAKWAETKQFVVGDTIVFKYSSSHNVMEVGGPDFLACNKAATTNALKPVEDRITLDKAGRRWFFCSVGQHCKDGMKLKITVLETAAPAPALPPSSPAGSVRANFGQAAAAVTALAVAVLVL